jgi:hypothetical protein
MMKLWNGGAHLMVGWLWLAACVATPLPQPPSFDLDTELVQADADGTSVGFVGAPGALTPGPVGVRVTPGPTDSDPILEIGSGDVLADGSFEVLVLSPRENTFYFEAITDDADVFVAAVVVEPDGRVVEVDPGPDADADGSPDVIDCAPDDPSLAGQRCP